MPKMTATRPEPAIPSLQDLPAPPAKTDALLAAEAALDALTAERDQYEDLRTEAIERADVDALLRVDARATVLPSLIDAAEVAVHNARIAWMRTDWMPLFDDPLLEQRTAISDLVEQRRQIDEEILLRNPVIDELDGRRDGVRRQLRASELRLQELVARSPAARRALRRTPLSPARFTTHSAAGVPDPGAA